MRFECAKEYRSYLFRWFNKRGAEIAYAVVGIRGPRMDIEFPSDWHEHRRAWVRLGCGVLSVAFSFPWRRVVPDDDQCSGPTYGFYWFGSALVVEYGKDTSRYMRKKFIHAPWSWEHVRHDYLNPDGSLHHRCGPQEYSSPEETKHKYPYLYLLHTGEVQERIATINGEEREWRWRAFTWLRWPRMIHRTICVEFSDEVGERSGSWKGGTIGCSWGWRHGESMADSLRRMEAERKFT